MNNLLTAIYNGEIENVKRLIEGGAEVDKPGDNENYPIYAAIQSDDPAMLNLIIGLGADTNQDLGKGWTPLHEAFDFAMDGMIQNNKVKPYAEAMEMIRVLLQNGADLQNKDDAGRTPLDVLRAYAVDDKKFDELKNLFASVIHNTDS